MVRSAVVDLGSNSVRLVVFEGTGRNPAAIFNERAVLRLGRGLQTTGRLNEEGVTAALGVMHRYGAIARAMGCEVLEVLATAAVRDASNGAAFVAGLRERMPGVVIRILSGEEEAALSAAGVLCGIPQASGILADIGGGSLEVVRLSQGQPGQAQTLPLGVIRLADRAEGDLARARALVEADLAEVPWLFQHPGRDLYLVGGAWRALARIHMAQASYPLAIVHHYTIGRDAARDLAGLIGAATGARWSGCPARRGGGWTTCPMPRSCCAACCARRRPGAWCSAPTASARAGTWPASRPRPRGRIRSWPRAATWASATAATRDAGGPDGLDGGPVRRRAAGRGTAAPGRLPAVRCRQPRPSGVPRRTGLPPRPAPIRRGAGPSRPRLPGDDHRHPLRGRPGQPDAGRGASVAGRADAARPRSSGRRCASPTSCPPARRPC